MMVTSRNIGQVIRILRRTVSQWDEPVVSRLARGSLETTPSKGSHSGRGLRRGVVGHYRADPFTTLISCLLSLRTKDATTRAASERLFRLARTPAAMSQLSPRRIEQVIYPVGFYRTKARTILAVCRVLMERHACAVPSDLETLLRLPGVGRKTANLVVTLAFRKPGICVDTHVHRISNRWGYVKTRSPEATEFALRRRLPRRYWRRYNDLLVAFGQHLCHPTSPWCSRCPLARVCAKVGVTRSR